MTHEKIYDIQDALELAASLRDGVIDGPIAPLPTEAEALIIIEAAIKRMPFNWLTGQRARDTLKGLAY